MKRKAAERIHALQPGAVDAIQRGLAAEIRQLDRQGEVRVLGPDHAAQTRAATVVLDRTGTGPSSHTGVSIKASQHLADLIAQMDA